MTVHEQLKQTARALEQVSMEARCEAEIILAHAYGIEKSALIMRFFDEAEHQETIDRILRHRLEGPPLAYILHSQNFYGRDFYVDERVLIPRFDTECVAEEAISRIVSEKCRNVADICCGSGCLGTTIALETGPVNITFGDVCDDALKVARLNYERLGGARGARFVRGDLLDVIDEPQDLIVVNPPYIPAPELPLLEPQVRDFEPRKALDGGEDGLDFYRRLSAEGAAKLTRGGAVLCEVGDGQAAACERLFLDAGWTDTETGKDWSGTTRWIAARRK